MVVTKIYNKTQQFGVRCITPPNTHGEKQKHEKEIKYLASPTPLCFVGVLERLTLR